MGTEKFPGIKVQMPFQLNKEDRRRCRMRKAYKCMKQISKNF